MTDYVIEGDWLCVDVGRHTCGAGGLEYPHEPGCGLEPVIRFDALTALLNSVVGEEEYGSTDARQGVPDVARERSHPCAAGRR